MADNGDFCALSRAAEVFATRWTPIIVRNLLLGMRTFTAIFEGAPGISRTVLTQRLRMLEQQNLVVRVVHPDVGVEYRLTPAGEALRPVCDALGMWGERWIELVPAEVDAANVLRMLAAGLRPDELPERRTVVRFELRGQRPRRYWLLLDAPSAEVCRRPPGPDDDVVITTTSEWLAKWHTGRTSVGASMKTGAVRFDGPLDLVRRVTAWGGRGVYDRPLLDELAGAGAISR